MPKALAYAEKTYFRIDTMTNYRNRDTGKITGELILRSHVKSGTWEGEEQANGTWVIIDGDDERQVLEPID